MVCQPHTIHYMLEPVCGKRFETCPGSVAVQRGIVGKNTSKHHDLEIVPQEIPAQDLPELIAIGPQKHETQDEGTVESSVVCSLNSGILVMGVLNMEVSRKHSLGYEKHGIKRGSHISQL